MGHLRDDDQHGAFFNEQNCTRRNWRRVEKETQSTHEADGVNIVFNVLWLEFQGAIEWAIRFEGLWVGVRVLMKARDQLAKVHRMRSDLLSSVR